MCRNKQEHGTQTYAVSYRAKQALNGQVKGMNWEEVRTEQVFFLPLVFRQSCTNSGKRHREPHNNDFHSFFIIPIITMPTKRRIETNRIQLAIPLVVFKAALSNNDLQRRETLSNLTNNWELPSFVSSGHARQYTRSCPTKHFESCISRKRPNRLQSLDGCLESV